MSNPLDDRSQVTRLDPKGMLAFAEDFPEQCRRALRIAREATLEPLGNRPGLVCLTGLGGSAAGGDFVRALFEAQGAGPFLVNRDYALPNYVGLGDLVFCSSYSGNTEETLSAYASAKRAGAKIIALCSGGRLAEMAEADGHPVIRVPGGQPPRASLGYMLIPIVEICERLKLIPEQPYEAAFALLDRCAREWTVEGEDRTAKELAEALYGGVGILYGLGSWQAAVANRWKGQINENAKNMAFANAFPELNHNEILGWVGADSQGVGRWVGILLQDGAESSKMRTRARVTMNLIGDRCGFKEATAKGESLLEKMLSLTLLGDFVSLYLAALNSVDPETIDWINVLKAELAKTD